MKNKRVASVRSNTMVYHYPECRYAQRIQPKYKLEKSRAGMELDHFRPCKCCGTMEFQVKQEYPALEKYIKGKDLYYKQRGNSLYIWTEISCWKLVYGRTKQDFLLFHRNASDRPIDHEHLQWESYHRQMDRPHTASIIDAFTYIYQHDQFRKAEKEAGGEIKIWQLDKKYQASAVRRQRKQKSKRLDYLFSQLERENEGLKQLSYC